MILVFYIEVYDIKIKPLQPTTLHFRPKVLR